jgi:hypothetical protein
MNMTPGNRNASVYWALLFCAVANLFGCQNYEKETAIVRGTITLDGNPVTKGTVMFVPRAGRSGRGVIQADGTFQVSTYGDGDGAIVGENQVAVVVVFGEDAKAEEVKMHLLPVKYASTSTSGIVYDVKAGEENQVHLKLESE